MDVKEGFDYILKNQLILMMTKMGVDGDLIKWTKSFLTDRTVQLVIDGDENPKPSIETKIPQGSPISSIIFLIYISEVSD